MVDADLVMCGHTHTQFDRTLGGVRVVNSGSVGMPYEDEPGAYWTLLGPGVEHRRTSYELDTGDYPFDWPVGIDFVLKAPFLKNAEKEAILGGNLVKLLHIT